MKSLFENPCRAVKVYYPIGQINAVSKHSIGLPLPKKREKSKHKNKSSRNSGRLKKEVKEA
ncbi:hypothetical protein LguiA_036156 [Lonicera macranthoides]